MKDDWFWPSEHDKNWAKELGKYPDILETYLTGCNETLDQMHRVANFWLRMFHFSTALWIIWI